MDDSGTQHVVCGRPLILPGDEVAIYDDHGKRLCRGVMDRVEYKEVMKKKLDGFPCTTLEFKIQMCDGTELDWGDYVVRLIKQN